MAPEPTEHNRARKARKAAYDRRYREKQRKLAPFQRPGSLVPDNASGAGNVPADLRASLIRLRNWGLPFDRAWPRACARARMPHDHEDRRAWRRLMADPAYIELWCAAYERRPGPNVMGTLRAALEEDESSVVLKSPPGG